MQEPANEPHRDERTDMTKNPFKHLTQMTFLLAATLSVQADVLLFNENFESNNLVQWTGKLDGPHQGRIVADPFCPANHVLTFTGVDFGGDMLSAAPIVISPDAPRRYVLSFAFLGLANGGVPPTEFGGFLGLAPSPTDYSVPFFWVAGTYAPEVNTLPTVGKVIVADGTWHRYEIDVTDLVLSNRLAATRLVLEDWGGLGSVPGDVYFDNIRLVGKLDPSVFSNLVPCSGPAPGKKWKNHGQFVSTMSKVVETYLVAGEITLAEAERIIEAAARSDCGKK